VFNVPTTRPSAVVSVWMVVGTVFYRFKGWLL
jgi:hypothetical protein